MYSAKIGDQEFQISFQKNSLSKGSVNASEFSLDLLKESDYELHLISGNKSYDVELMKFDEDKKLATIQVNGNRYEVSLKDKYDLLLDKLGLDLSSSKKVNEVKAPMPGLVLRMEVAAGDSVEEGQPLLVLEAMKMENVLKSPTAGVVSAILVKEGAAVEKNEILLKFE